MSPYTYVPANEKLSPQTPTQYTYIPANEQPDKLPSTYYVYQGPNAGRLTAAEHKPYYAYVQVGQPPNVPKQYLPYTHVSSLIHRQSHTLPSLTLLHRSNPPPPCTSSHSLKCTTHQHQHQPQLPRLLNQPTTPTGTDPAKPMSTSRTSPSLRPPEPRNQRNLSPTSQAPSSSGGAVSWMRRGH